MRREGRGARLAAWASGLSLDRVPGEVVESTKLRILDLVGVMLAARPLELVAAARRAARATDGGTGFAILGEDPDVSFTAAAFVNGVLSAALEFDDTHIESFVHPTAPSVSVAFPACQAGHRTGRTLIEAVLAGMEVTCRLGLVPPVRLHNLGFHPTAVFGVFGAACTLGRLRGLSAAAMADALGAAGSLSAGLNASFEDGSSTKMLHVGMAAAGAVRAVDLAAEGISGPAGVFEGRFGWFRSHLQGEEPRLDRLDAELGERWEALKVASKVHPCAFTMMPHIEAALALRAAHGIRAEEVEEVTCLIGRRSFATMCEPVPDKRRPATSWHGRISLQHTVAEALVRGRMDKDAYAEASLRDPAINALADRVTYADDPATRPDRSGGTVRLRMRDGRELAHRVEDMRGTPANPMTAEEVVAKFRANVRGILPPETTDAAAEGFLRLETLPDVAPLFDALREGKEGT